MRKTGILGSWLLVFFFPFLGWAQEKISLQLPGEVVRGELVKVTKDEVVLKQSNGLEKTIPALVMDPKDYIRCARMAMNAGDAKAHLDLGQFCLKKGLTGLAQEEFKEAVRLDEKLKDQVSALIPKIDPPPPLKVTSVVKDTPKELPEPDKKTGEKKEPGKEPAVAANPEPKKDGEKDEENEDGEKLVEVTDAKGRKFKVPARFLPSKEETKPWSEAEAKDFVQKRLEDLKKKCGSAPWRVEETAHFYCFSNLDPADHSMFKDYNEQLYKKLSDVLRHVEGGKLWHNKCPVYYFRNRNDFIKFASEIDGVPGAAFSGGYFNHKGRRVHIAIPFNDRTGKEDQRQRALETLFHEGSHAFLQLMGEDIMLSRWLHEGFAQFIEFWFNEKARKRAVVYLQQAVQGGRILSWKESRMRPGFGGDIYGYAFAWARMQYLYQIDESKVKIPKFIREVKSGTDEDEALEKVFGQKVDQLELAYHRWLDYWAKRGFKFDQP